MKEPKKSSQNDELDEQALGNVSGGYGELICKDGKLIIETHSPDGKKHQQLKLDPLKFKKNTEFIIPLH